MIGRLVSTSPAGSATGHGGRVVAAASVLQLSRVRVSRGSSILQLSRIEPRLLNRSPHVRVVWEARFSERLARYLSSGERYYECAEIILGDINVYAQIIRRYV